MNGSAALDAAAVERELGGKRLGLPLAVFDSTTSSSDEAKRALAAGAGHGACFVAEAQTHGRGRRGRSWLAAPGEALLFSLLLDAPHGFDPSPLTLAVGLGVHAGTQPHVSAPLAVKWPNDLVCGRQKLAGILVEAELSQGVLGAVVVGVGINVLATAFPPELEASATSLRLLGSTVSRERVLVDVLEGIAHWYERLCQGGAGNVVPALRQVDALRDEPIRVDGVPGTGAGFDDSGRLLLRLGDGTVQSIVAGTVEWGW